MDRNTVSAFGFVIEMLVPEQVRTPNPRGLDLFMLAQRAAISFMDEDRRDRRGERLAP